MAKFCRSCGSPLQEGDQVCGACGAPVQRAEVPVVQKQAPDAVDKISEVIGTIFGVVEKLLVLAGRKIKSIDLSQATGSAADTTGSTVSASGNANLVRTIVLVVMAVLCLVAAVMNLFGTYNVNVTASVTFDSQTQKSSSSGPIRDLYDADEYFFGLQAVNIIYGIGNVVLVGLAALLVLMLFKKKNIDQMFLLYALVGFAGNVLYMILFALCGHGSESVLGATLKYSVGVHFITWILVVLYALLAAANILLPVLLTKMKSNSQNTTENIIP